MSGPLAIALLAAGEARRFGGGKLDAALRGKPVGRHALDAALALEQDSVLIVVGDPVPAFAREAEGVELIANPNATDGLGTSVALAARHALEGGHIALLLLAADMPLVSPHSLRRLVEACAPGIPAAARQADAQPGIPACFPCEWFEALAALTGDRGAGALLRAAEVRPITLPADELADIDVPEDLNRLA